MKCQCRERMWKVTPQADTTTGSWHIRGVWTVANFLSTSEASAPWCEISTEVDQTLHVVAGALGKGNTHVSYQNSQVITSCPVQSIMADTDVRSSGELKRQS